ncbi:MAG: hypothetical protein C4304_05645 [candidate division GAL15 bacterium]
MKAEAAARIPQIRVRVRGRWPGWMGAVPIYGFFLLFVVYPLLRLLAEAVTDEAGRLTGTYLVQFLQDPFYRKALVNSVWVAGGTVLGCLALGLPAAFLLVRYDFPGRDLWSYLTVLPVVMPPLVGIMGLVFVLGRAGTVNVLLMDLFGLVRPVNFLYGWHGVLLAMVLHYFPLVTLNVVDGLTKVDASLEEAAEALGSRGLRRVWDITLPLLLPGLVSGATLVFILSFADFATPLVVGMQDLLAAQAYLNIVQFVDRRLFRMGLVVGALMCLMAVGFLVVARRVVAMREYAVVSYRAVERQPLRVPWRVVVPACFAAVLGLAFLPHVGLLLAAFGKAWSLTPFPTRFTLEHFDQVLHLTPTYVVNSLRWAAVAVVLILLLGVATGWILARTSLPGRELLDAVVTLILALPGTAVGIAYLRAFHAPLPGFSLTRSWFVMPLVLAVRRLPYTVRATFASLLTVHRAMEEAAASVGASGFRIFRDISLPLMWRGVVAGALFSLLFALQEAAATILLVLPGWETITVGIFTFYTSGTFGQAAALGVVLVSLCAAILYAIYRLTGARLGGLFGTGGA